MGFRVSGSGFRPPPPSLGFEDSDLWSRVYDLGLRVSGLRFRVLGFRDWGLEYKVQDLGFRFNGSGCRR